MESSIWKGNGNKGAQMLCMLIYLRGCKLYLLWATTHLMASKFGSQNVPWIKNRLPNNIKTCMKLATSSDTSVRYGSHKKEFGLCLGSDRVHTYQRKSTRSFQRTWASTDQTSRWHCLLTKDIHDGSVPKSCLLKNPWKGGVDMIIGFFLTVLYFERKINSVESLNISYWHNKTPVLPHRFCWPVL